MKQHAILIWLGLTLVVVFLGGAANLYKAEFIQQLDVFLYDQRLGLTMPNTLDERIVIIDIDEKSLKEEGRWPWGRDRLAVLVDKLFGQYSVAVAGFDVVFAEKDDSSGLKVLQKLGQNQLKDSAQFQTVLEQIKPRLDYDSIFADTIKNRKVVLGYYFNNSKQGSGVAISGALPDAVFPSGTFGKRPIAFVSWDGYGGNLAELQSNAASAGYINPLVDFDGVVRRLPMIMEYNGAYFESLSLAMTRVLLGSPKLAPGYASGGNTDYAGLEWLSLAIENNDLQIPIDQHVSALVPYRGKEGSFRYIPATDVINGRVPVADLNNKIVLIGTSAPGLLDLRSTPVGEVYPGVEIHANMIAGILDQNLKHRPAYAVGAEVVLLLVIGVALSFFLPLLSPMHAILLSGVSMVAVLLGNFSLWHVA
ncbi:MAG: CHASE2 domain-containing protein, partial [Candidatus Nitrotoga sp.]